MNIIDMIKIMIRYYDNLLNEDEKKLLMRLNKECKNIDFTMKTNKKELHIKNFCQSKNMLKWAIKNGYIMNVKTSYFIENIEMMKYYNKKMDNLNNLSFIKKICSCFDNIEDKKEKFNSATFRYAAKNGNLEIIKWLLKKGYKFDEMTLMCAVINGNIENIRWLLDNNCPYYKITELMIKEKYKIEI